MDAIEIYVLCGSRSKRLADVFLDAYLPHRTCVASEFPYPEYSNNPKFIFSAPDKLLEQLETDPGQSYSLYWDSNNSGEISQAMLFYTIDGAMIAGLAGTIQSPGNAILNLASVVNGRYGYMTSEECPPDTKADFIETCRNSTQICLFDGDLRNLD